MRHYTSTVEFNKGLRPLENTKTEGVYLVKADGVRNVDGALHTLEGFSRVVTIDPVLQFEQLKNHTILITTTSFYELVNGSQVLKLALPSSERWGIADYGDFILFVDSDRTVIRDPLSGLYSLTSEIPSGFDAINYNGQCLIIGTTD